MRQLFLGVLVGLVFAGLGIFWWQGRAQVERFAPPPPEPLATPILAGELPSAEIDDLVGPEPPEASALTREELRFFRYDRNRDRIITRYEMLSTRTAGFRSLDTDGNNLLTFEEWAVTTADRFEGADTDGNGQLTPAEFATTASKPRSPKHSKCAC